MNTNNKPQKPISFWRNIFGRRPVVDEQMPEEAGHDQTEPAVSPLVRIQDYLSRHGLGQQVRARCETVGSGFVLEDDDGQVHAKDYLSAVAMIERIWLYRPGS